MMNIEKITVRMADDEMASERGRSTVFLSPCGSKGMFNGVSCVHASRLNDTAGVRAGHVQ